MRLVAAFLILCAFTGTCIADENKVDVLFLKNGSIIKGEIIELNPMAGGHVKIKTQDGSEFVYPIEEVKQVATESLPALMRPPRKSPGAALALSLVLGGLLPIQGTGQWYNGEIGKGFGYLTAGLLGYGAFVYGVTNDNRGAGTGGAILYLVSYTLSAVDAHNSAKRINQESGYEEY